MAKITVSALIEGGKASPAPPLGPAIAPTGANIGQIIVALNEKTKAFAGMSVPVKVIIEKSNKSFEIEVGTPPASALIKSEAGIKTPVKEETGVKGKKTIGNISMEQVVKIAKMKETASLARALKSRAKEVMGTCLSLGVTVEGKNPKQAQKDVDAKKYDALLKE